MNCKKCRQELKEHTLKPTSCHGDGSCTFTVLVCDNQECELQGVLLSNEWTLNKILYMKTFNKELKQKLIAEIKKHMKADQIIQGTYGEKDGGKWRGCAVGCSIRSLNIINKTDFDTDDHYSLARVLGTTPQLHYLEDKIFEGLPKEKAMEWPLRFTEALPEESDVSFVVPKLMVWIGEQMKALVDDKKVKEAWDKVIELYMRVIRGEHVSSAEWFDAAEYAAVAAKVAEYAATYAAEYAAKAAEYAATYAAEYAATYAASVVGDNKFYEKMADKLIELLEECELHGLMLINE